MNPTMQSRQNVGRPLAMISIAMGVLVIAILSPKFLPMLTGFSPDRLDLARGLLFGIAIGMALASVIRIVRLRRAARMLAMLLFLGALASTANAGQALPPCCAKSRDASFTTSDGVELNYKEAGSGPTIVFIPGWTMPGMIWSPQIEHFSEHFHVVALDPRSQGMSAKVAEGNNTQRRARDIKELIDHLKSGPVVLVGWSLGVPELLSYAEQFGGESVRGYVLVDGFAWDKLDPQFVMAMLGTYNQVQTSRREFTARFVRSMFRKPQPDAYLEWLTKMSLLMPTDSAIAASVSSISRTDWTPAIRKLDRPVLVTCEAGLKPMAADPVRAIVPTAQIELFEEAGHALFVDDPEHFNSVLEKFITGLSAGDTGARP